jgi:hypothetical protein
MKTKLLFILGAVAWIVFFMGLALGSYQNHQKAQAATSSQQNQLVTKHESNLEVQLATYQAELQTADSNLAQAGKDKQAACNSLTQVKNDLTKYKVNLAVTVPAFCQ